MRPQTRSRSSSESRSHARNASQAGSATRRSPIGDERVGGREEGGAGHDGARTIGHGSASIRSRRAPSVFVPLSVLAASAETAAHGSLRRGARAERDLRRAAHRRPARRRDRRSCSALPPIRPATAGVPGWPTRPRAHSSRSPSSVLAALWSRPAHRIGGFHASWPAAGAALAGGAMALLAGAPSIGRAARWRAPRCSARARSSAVSDPGPAWGAAARSRLPSPLMAMGEAAAVLAARRPRSLSAVDPARAAALLGGMAIGGASAIAFVGRGSVASAILVGVGALGTLADRGGSLGVDRRAGALRRCHAVRRAASWTSVTSADRRRRRPAAGAWRCSLADAVLRFDGHLRLRDWNQPRPACSASTPARRGARLEELLGICARPSCRRRRTPSAPRTGSAGSRSAIHAIRIGVTAVIRDPGISPEAERLGRELRRTIEELLQSAAHDRPAARRARAGGVDRPTDRRREPRRDPRAAADRGGRRPAATSIRWRSCSSTSTTSARSTSDHGIEWRRRGPARGGSAHPPPGPRGRRPRPVRQRRVPGRPAPHR